MRQFDAVWNGIAPVGIGQRWEGEEDARRLYHLGQGLDFLEITMPGHRPEAECPFAVLTHSSELPLATTGDLNMQMVSAIAGLVRDLDPPWTGEHFALVSAEATGDLGYNFAPILDSRAVEATVRNVERLKEAYGRPLAIEASPRYFETGGWDDHGAILEVSRRTGCGILIDLSHHVVSMRNLGRTLTDGLSEEVLERCVELHVTGVGLHRGGRFYHDDHATPVPQEVWTLLEWMAPKMRCLLAAVLEHDATVDEVQYLRDLGRLREVVGHVCGT